MLRLALRNLTRNRRRSLLSLAAMATGGAALILFLGFMENAFRGVRDTTIRTQTGHFQILHRDWDTKSEMRPLELGIEGWEKIAADLARDPNVAVVAPRIEVNGIVLTKTRASATYLGTAVDPRAELAIMTGPGDSDADPAIVENYRRLAAMPDGVVLGRRMVRNLGLKPGDPLRLYAAGVAGLRFVEARLAGEFAGPIMETDRYFAFVGLGKAQELLESNKVSKLVVTVKDESRLDASIAGARAAIARHGIAATARPWTDFAQFYDALVKLYRAMFLFMGGIVAALVVFAITNTMVMAVMERVPEIGTFMAIGMPRRTVMSLFLLEGAFLGLAGALGGLALGALGTLAINNSGLRMPPPPGATTAYPLHLVPTPEIYALAFAVMLVTTIVASLYPANKASRLEVIEALAHT